MSVSDLVGEIEGVRRRTRRASSGAAVPLALLGLLVALAAPVYAAAVNSTILDEGEGGYFDLAMLTQGPSTFERLLRVHPNNSNYDGLGVYWLIAAPLTFAAIAAYYAFRARRTGLSIDGWRVTAAGVGAFAGLVLTMYFGGGATQEGYDGDLRVGNFLNPFLVVAIGVFALAWVERGVGVLLTAVAFLGAVVLADVVVYSQINDYGWGALASWGWSTLILGGVLLLAATVAGVVRLARRA